MAVLLTDGLGNRLFQIAAILGYAERYCHTAVIVNDWNFRNKHSEIDYLPMLFPDIPRISTAEFGEFTEIHMTADEAFTWRELPFHSGNVRLNGYFQNVRYIPAEPIFPRILLEVPGVDMHSCAFLHVRRGDYIVYAEHAVPMDAYWQRCFENVTCYIIIFSNDFEWCRQRFIGERFRFAPASMNPLETLAAMARCRGGGICANSSFSWWGAYFNTVIFGEAEGRIFFPDRWVNPPLPPADGVYPPWASKVSVAE